MIDDEILRHMATIGANQWSAIEAQIVIAQAIQANRIAADLRKAVALLKRASLFRVTAATSKLDQDRREFLKNVGPV